MSARKIDARVVASILATGFDKERACFCCGCSDTLSKRWFLCTYHDGYSDALDESDAECMRLRGALQAVADFAGTRFPGAADKDAEIAALKAALRALCEIDDAFAAHTKGCGFLNCATCNEHAMKQEYAFMDAKELLGAARVAAGTALGQEARDG